MSIQSQINRITGAKDGLATYLDDNGVSVPAGTKIDGMVALLDSVPKGIDTSDADAIADDIAQGKTAYVDGKKVTGNIYVINQETHIDATPNWNENAGTLFTSFGAIGARIILDEEKWVYMDIPGAKLGDAAAADVAEGKTFTSENGLKLTGTKQAPVPVTQATPTITVSDSGLITAKSTQGAGLVSAGTKQATKQLTVQAAQTITPGTSNKTIASGRYLTGTQTIKGDANLVPENIKYGTSIFGVVGTFAGGGGDLPDGVAAIARGTYTPASDQTGTFSLTHNLGVIPNLFILYCEGPVKASEFANMTSHVMYIGKSHETQSIHYTGHQVYSYCNTSGGFSFSGYRTTSSWYIDDNYMQINISTTKLKTGLTYNWVAAHIEGLE